jgi:hypothetical protein
MRVRVEHGGDTVTDNVTASAAATVATRAAIPTTATKTEAATAGDTRGIEVYVQRAGQ